MLNIEQILDNYIEKHLEFYGYYPKEIVLQGGEIENIIKSIYTGNTIFSSGKYDHCQLFYYCGIPIRFIDINGTIV